MVDGPVSKTLKDERRLRKRRLERIVPKAVFEKTVIQQPFRIGAVMKERERAPPAPLVKSIRGQEMMTRLGDRRRKQHQAIDLLRELRCGQDGECAAQTRSDECTGVGGGRRE